MKVFYNGHLYQQNASAFVEDGGKIIYIGNDEEACTYSDEWIDLKGKYVYPGFNDTHMHVVNYGQFLNQVSLYEHTSSLQDMLDELKKHLDQKWIIGRGWNHDYFLDVHRFPTRQDLDSVSLDIPIVITRACGHVCVANTKAIELAGLLNHQIEDVDLEQGLFKENGVYYIYDAMPQPTIQDIKNYILLAQQKLHSYGITSVQSDDFLSATSSYHDALSALEQLRNQQQLTIRIYEQSQFLNIESLQEFINQGYHTGVGNEYFKIGPLKIIGDGSLGARTAFLSKPYQDQKDTQGISVYPKNILHDMIMYAHTHHMQIAIHAIGDGILDWVLESYQEALKQYPQNDHRHGIVHCQITRKDQLEMFQQLHLHAYFQSIFLDYDNHIVESRVGKDLAQTSYNFKTLLETTSASNGSDCPVESPDVLKGIQLAITRTSIDGKGPYLKQQALTVEQAIDSFTKNGAYASFEEDVKGQIKVGMYCDFVVLDEAIEDVDVFHIKDIDILATYVAGNKVYSKK